jgi:hypothetical protein
VTDVKTRDAFPEIDADGRLSAKELYAWLMAKADQYHGLGSGMDRFMNAGRVDALWTIAADVQHCRDK